jgi:hypothetical protein
MSKQPETQTCTLCGTEKPLDQFYYHRVRKYRMTDCMACNNANSKAYQKTKRSRGDYKFLLRARAAGIRRDCKSRKGGSIEVSPDLGNILCELWETQIGKCFYTDLPMLLGAGLYVKDPAFCTVDRIDSDRGYIAGNVVLCRASVNRCKGNMPPKVWFDLCTMITKRRKKIEQQIKLKG